MLHSISQQDLIDFDLHSTGLTYNLYGLLEVIVLFTTLASSFAGPNSVIPISVCSIRIIRFS